MYYHDLGKQVLFWNPRCGLSTLREWCSRVTKEKIPLTPEGPYAKVGEGKENILIVRDPIDRFVSILNHPLVFHYLGPAMGIGRIELFLDLLEKNGLNFNDHLRLQCRLQDKPGVHETEDISSFFTHIIRLEDGNLIEKVNKLTRNTISDIWENTRDKKLKHFIAYNPGKYPYKFTDMDMITEDILNEERIERIKKLYHWDYIHFYPELL